MIHVTTNISSAIDSINAKIAALTNVDALLRTVAVNMLPEVKERIHTEGKAADGNGIGTYSKGYMAVRTGQFKSNGEVTRGKDKGQTRNKGVYTKGKKKGEPRFPFNRTGDTKVVISLTRQMENDFSVLPNDNGGYGLGYNNPENVKKVEYVEHTYGKKIFSLTDGEHEKTVATAQEYVDNINNG
jgi:hypothetical protein